MAKSSRPMVRIHDLETNTIVDREMNDEEFSQWQADQKAQKDLQAELEAKAAEKAILLERLGITEDEAKLLLG
jgi:hypothetical protein